MATEEEAVEAIYGAIVRLASNANQADVISLAEAFAKLVPEPETTPEDKGVTTLTGGDLVPFDPNGTWWEERGLGFTPRNIARGQRPTHKPPETFS